MRIFKTRAFARFADRGGMEDAVLRDAVRRAKSGRANLRRDEMKAFRALADEMLAMDEAGLEAALANGTIFSVI